MVQRTRSNKRHQLLGKSVDAFIQDLYRLAEDYEHGSQKDGLIRDQIVVGVLDDTLSDRLQAKAHVTLEQAVQMSTDLIRGNSVPSAASHSSGVEFVEKHKPEKRSTKASETRPKSKRKCMWCGRQQHRLELCPAKDVTTLFVFL